jgi:hypothetical protein
MNLINLVSKRFRKIAKECIDASFKPDANKNEFEAALKHWKSREDLDLKRWKAEKLAIVASSGAVVGSAGVTGWVIMPIELMLCGKVAGLGCLGVGYLLGRQVDPDDIDWILAVWSGILKPVDNVEPGEIGFLTNEKADSSSVTDSLLESAKLLGIVPVGKSAIKISVKAVPKVTGVVVGTILSKKAFGKLSPLILLMLASGASKATTKLTAKLIATLGPASIPIIGGAACAGVNVWLVESFLKAAEDYYSHNYVVVDNSYVRRSGATDIILNFPFDGGDLPT